MWLGINERIVGCREVGQDLSGEKTLANALNLSEKRKSLTSFSSIDIGQPVPTEAYRSWQNEAQKVLLLSSRSVQSRGGGRHCFTSRPTPSCLCKPNMTERREALPQLSHARGKYIILNSYIVIRHQHWVWATLRMVSPRPFISSIVAYLRAR